MHNLQSQILNSLFANDFEFKIHKKPQFLNDFLNLNKFTVRKIPFISIKNWYFDLTYNINHESGKFFQICGLKYNHKKKDLSQIIINQPEIGILGFITKIINNKLYFLIQIKFEPGNIGVVQISPSVQATKSNYTAVHNGTAVPLLQYFQTNENKIFDISLSEQAGRFYKKTNRNIICLTNTDIEILPNFKWITLKELLSYIKLNNVVNMNARSILSCINYCEYGKQYSIIEATDFYKSYVKNETNSFGLNFFISSLNTNLSKHNTEEIINWLKNITHKKTRPELINLYEIKDIFIKKNEIYSSENPEFKIIALKIAAQREITSWCQPIIRDCYIRLHGFLVKKINGVLHFLAHANLEPGNIKGAELGPTVQGIPINLIQKFKNQYLEYFRNPLKKNILLSVLQSDEGGRFYKVQNLNIIILINDDFKCKNNYKWITLFQLKEMIHLGHVNMEARSIISCINFYE